MTTPGRSLDTRAKAEQGPINLSCSESATTVYSEFTGQGSRAYTDSGTESMSGESVYTYNSADAGQFRKEENGRLWSTLNEKYFMPADDEEYMRLNKQHIALVLGLGGLYPAKEVVRAILAPKEGETKRVLDLGCGNGVWMTEMAREFPHVHFFGVDLVPVPTAETDALPSNVSFEVDDINLGLDHYEGQFDLVHCRMLGAGLHDAHISKNDIQACLKPGGLLLCIDVDYDVVDENGIDYIDRASEKREGGSWCARVLYEAYQAALSAGQDNPKMGHLLDEGLWDDPLMDPTTCHNGSLCLPVGPWVNDENPEQAQRLKYLGSLMRQNLSGGIWLFHSILKKSGIPEATLEEWSTKGDEEMALSSKHMWIRYILAWGQRWGPSDYDAPVEPEDPPQTPPYPYLVLCDSQENALLACKERSKRREQIPLPPPLLL